TIAALADFDIGKNEAARAKNMFALGLVSWLYSRPIDSTEEFIAKKFAARGELAQANIAALRAGHAYGETTETFAVRYEVPPATLPAGTYRNITGNLALAYGLVAAGVRAKLPVFLGTHPITPASALLPAPSTHRRLHVTA